MTEELTIETGEIPGGYTFRRSDGQQFFMVWVGGTGSANLYAGASPNMPPSKEIVGFDASVSDKIAAARLWILAYPDRPSD